MEKKTKYRLSGVAAGLTNGIFGGGGGIPLLVLLTKWAGVEEKKAFATCVAVIFPMCAVSATLYLWRAELSLLRPLLAARRCPWRWPCRISSAASRADWSAGSCSKRCRTSGCGAFSRSFCSMAAGAIFSREAER